MLLLFLDTLDQGSVCGPQTSLVLRPARDTFVHLGIQFPTGRTDNPAELQAL